jgi:hypothetical protein
MGPYYSKTNPWAGFLLALSFLDLFLVYFVSRDGYAGRLREIERLGITGIPNPSFFKFIWPLFILSASFGLFWASLYDPTVMWYWAVILILIFLLAFFLFGRDDFQLWPLALLTALALVITLGAAIFYCSLMTHLPGAAALLGFFFIWSIYSLYFISATLMTLLSGPPPAVVFT